MPLSPFSPWVVDLPNSTPPDDSSPMWDEAGRPSHIICAAVVGIQTLTSLTLKSEDLQAEPSDSQIWDRHSA